VNTKFSLQHNIKHIQKCKTVACPFVVEMYKEMIIISTLFLINQKKLGNEKTILDMIFVIACLLTFEQRTSF